MSGIQKSYQDCKEAGRYTHNKEKNHSIKTNPELTHMLEFAKTLNTYHVSYIQKAETWINLKKNKENYYYLISWHITKHSGGNGESGGRKGAGSRLHREMCGDDGHVHYFGCNGFHEYKYMAKLIKLGTLGMYSLLCINYTSIKLGKRFR